MEGEKACPSKTEDGDQCGFKLTFGFKWCPGCGAKVDPALFQKKAAEIMVPDTQTDVYTRRIPSPTISSTRTESGNPVTQNEVNLPNSGEKTKDTNENADSKDNTLEGEENEIVDVLKERELEDKGGNEHIKPNVKEDKDKEVDVEKELLAGEERKTEKRKERDKGLFGEEGGTGNSDESFDERQKRALDVKRNEEKNEIQSGAYQENKQKESDRVEEIKNEEKIGFDIKSDGPDSDKNREIEIKERTMDAREDREKLEGEEAFENVGDREEVVGPESSYTVEMLGDQNGGEIPKGENVDDIKIINNKNEIIEDRKEGPVAENDEDRVDVIYKKGRGAKGEITIYMGQQGEKDEKRKAEEEDLERMGERIEKKRKVNERRIEENKGNETNSNEESERQQGGDNENEIKEEKEEQNEEQEEEEEEEEEEGGFDSLLQPSDEDTLFSKNLAENNRSSFKGYNDQQIEQDTLTTDNNAQHMEGMEKGGEVIASDVKILVDKEEESKNIEEEEQEEEEEKDKKVKNEEGTVDNEESSDVKHTDAVNGKERKEKKEEEKEKVEEESLNRDAISGSKREESRNESGQGVNQGDKKREIKGVEKERIGGEREAYCEKIGLDGKSSGPDKMSDESKENKNEEDGRKNENEDELMQQEYEENKRDTNIGEEVTVTETNSEVEGGYDTKGGADIKGGVEKKIGGPSNESLKDKGKGEERKYGNTEEYLKQPKERTAQPLDSSAQQTDSCIDNQPKKTIPVSFHAFLSPSVNFDKKKDSLYVVFGAERDDWECKPEGLMQHYDLNRKGNRMFAKVELERALLSQGLLYCYHIQRKSSENTSNEKEICLQPFYPYNGHSMLHVSPDLDSYQKFDGYIYGKKGGKLENVLTALGLMKSNMHKTMKKDGKNALKEYLPNICDVMKTINQSPLRIVEIVNEYCQVFKGGVKDQFSQNNDHCAPEIWQEFIMKDHLKQAIELLETQQNRMDKNGKLLKSLMIIKLLVNLEFDWKFLDNRTVEIIHHSLLLSPDIERNQCPQLEFLHTCLTPPIKRDIKRSLQLFLKESARKTGTVGERNPSWIMGLPIVHFLEGSLDPFAELDFTNFHDKQNDWWIDREFEKEKDELKSRKWSRSSVDLMNIMRPLFILDTKTQRGFMACLKLEDLEMAMREETILLEIKLATLQHYFEIVSYCSDMDHLLNCIKTVNEILRGQLAQFSSASKREWKTVDKRFFIQQNKCNAILSTGAQKCMIISDKGKLASLYHCNMLSLAAIEALCCDSNEVKSLLMSSTYLIPHILVEMKQEISVYDFALSVLVCLKKNESTALWERKCLQYAKQMIETLDTRRLLELYDAMTNLQSEALKHVIEDKVMNSIHSIVQYSQIQYFFERTWLSSTTRNNSLVSKLFSQMWTIDLKASDDTILGRALSSPMYPKCVEAYLSMSDIFRMMEPSAQNNLDRSVRILRALCWSLYENTVDVGTLAFIISKKENFLAVANVFERCRNENLPLTTAAFENLLLCRDKDLKSLEEVISTVEKLQFLFKEISERSNITITKIDEDSLQNWRFYEIKAVCFFPEESVGWNQYQPEVILFKELLLGLGDFVKNIYNYHESKSFHTILTILAVTYRNTPDLKFDDVVNKILIPTKQIWDDLCKKMRNGSISVREIEKFCFSEFSDDQLYGELVAMNRGRKDNWVKERITQLQRFQMFSKTLSIARLLLDVKEKYNINGIFENLELIANSETDKDVSLINMKIGIQEFNQVLEKINDDQKECIVSFLKSCDLVSWLKTALPGGIKDLKIYADLALLSVEGDEQVGRVTHLHSAAIGFSSVIFLNFSGENEMIEAWKEVWENLEKDKDLPKKLEESNRVLNWLMEIKESHGSVEVTSLKQVDAIKDRGIFKIGSSVKFVSSKHQLDLQDIIWLHVPATKFANNIIEDVERSEFISKQSSSEDVLDENAKHLMSLKLNKMRIEGEGRDYSLSEMTDLQSRLMLVTGKADAGRESIERFTSIFDNVTRLGKVFIQLLASGCILFKPWTFEFHCNPNAGSSVMIRTHERSVVKGTNFAQHSEESEVAQSNVNEYIRRIADFLESCYKEWVEYIKEKRNLFYPLNLYTVDQMVLLQEEIAKYRNGNQMTKFLCPLLSFVKSQCSLKPDLADAVDKVQEELLTSEQTSKMENTSQKTSHTEAIQKFLQIAEKSGISRTHALRAIQSEEFDIEDTDSGLFWCLSNEETNDEQENIQNNTSENNDSARDTTIGEKLKEIMETLELSLKQQEISQVIHNLDETWKKFLNCASSSATDFLSIDHLGRILDVLYESENGVIKRTLMDPLKCGKPNLIVCPQSDVIPMVFTLYMADLNLPLPNRNEVLLCTEHTTKEEVDIFFRRALFQSKSDRNERIFCLMNADKLQYDASEQSLKDVTEYIKAAVGGYKLVIICSSENEYKSPMISAMDKFRSPKIAVAGVKKIQEYLKKKYTPENEFDSSVDVIESMASRVRVVKSQNAGMGKSLYKTRLAERLLERHPVRVLEGFPLSITIPLSQKQIEESEVSNRIIECTLPDGVLYPRLFHIDIAYGIERFVGAMLFNMLVLGSLVNENGYVFHRSDTDLFIVETTLSNDEDEDNLFVSSIQLLNLLPSIICVSPNEVLENYKDMGTGENIMGFDETTFQSDECQRPYHYLLHYENKCKDIPVYNGHSKENDKKQCLLVLTRHCCVQNPSWAELMNFVHFLNTQLQDFEKSVYCSAILKEDLPGFPVFVLRFLIQMSKDFSTRSLDISEGKTKNDTDISTDDEDEGSILIGEEDTLSESDLDIKQFQMRRKWETSAHPYLFFNPDHNTMTFIGFNIDKYSRSLVDQQTMVTLERNIMSKQLWDALRENNVPLQENFDDLSREQKIERLCRVVGNDLPQDPDDTYELTTDNVKKMMAIYMRFRCGIPVIVMGETGCGKTCLIKFLCSLQCPAGLRMNTVTLMKVHGGTTKQHIIEKVRQAELLAESNCREHGKHIITVLFFDEANTTEAVGCIKEIMCDGTIDGQPLALNTNLKLVAACNPYRKHSDDMINRLERAGLGYHVKSDETDDKLGRIPMRHLVYRVQPLPQSMLPLVWDFGQLDNNVEKLYIIQMVQRCVRNGSLPDINRRTISILSDILAASQEFMRNQKDECSFVSLRDVDRTLKMFGWMYKQTEVFDAIEELELNGQDDLDLSQSATENARMTKALLLALGICYHASLKSRKEYRDYITRFFISPLELSNGGEEMEGVITRCQMAFLQNLKLNDNIAKNLALRENFFMMVVCVELRIPLFLVGKPGSSKSLSKTILDHNMQGRDSDSHLFKSLKQVQLISFQCSPLATADGILKTFKQASSFQKSKDLAKFVSVVVLDEVGLAEDSPRMPLKTLHPLLEDGCPDDEEYEEYKKVSFIGISNWALDPAKMNRGILVQREVPGEEDLVESARGICEQEEGYRYIENLIPSLAKAYLHVFYKACENDTLFSDLDGKQSEKLLKAREFFGLRDFYSLVKMISAVAVETRRRPTEQELITAIKRNFGGLEGLDPVQEFGKFLPFILRDMQVSDGIKTDTALLRECLKHQENKRESRYILLLTENYGALNLLHQLMGNEENTHVIFGSSFPRDQEYIEICRNINRIKVFMETGKTVILLNLENLYESLYDALNQYYMESGPDRYIDLGLGTHRVKCKVDKNFRLVVVAEKRVVYKEFPIPLINRMEKHFLNMEGMLTDYQLRLSDKLHLWAKEFSGASDRDDARPEEVFIGYNKDTAAGVTLKAWEMCATNSDDEIDFLQHRILEKAKDILLWGSTPDAVLRLYDTEQEMFSKIYLQKYFTDQCHESLSDFLQYRKCHDEFGGKFIQITTHSKLMSETDRQVIERRLPFLSGKISLLSLQAFDTEQQFSYQIREISKKGKELLLIQCDTGDKNSTLVECARHCVQRELQSNKLELCVVFLVHLSRVSKSLFSGFQTGLWTSVHIDELRLTSLPRIQDLMTKSISRILQESLCSEKNFLEEDEYESTVADLQGRHVNLRIVLFNCIHPALANIIEFDKDPERPIKRIKFIFNELNKSEQLTLTEGKFGYCLMKHIVTILSKHNARNADEGLEKISWIQSEAAMFASVNRTGTLRASCQKVIEERVTPLLAKIVAFLDTNNNLSVLEQSGVEHVWITNLWLGIFNLIDVDNLEKRTVACRHLFSASFPFSWLIYESIEEFLYVTSENIIGNSAEKLFMKSEIGNFIMEHLAIENINEATRLYMADFVKMSHRSSCVEEEMKIVCEFLHVWFEENMVGKEDNFLSRIFCMHTTFRNTKTKLETFSEILCLVPQEYKSFYQQVQNDIKELDIAAVRALFIAMEPEDKSIDTTDGQKQWIQNVQKCRPTIERFLHTDIDKRSTRGRLMVSLRTKWTKIVALKLFIQNLCIDTTRHRLMAQTCKILWMLLENSNFKDKSSLEKLEKFLKLSNNKAMNEFLGKIGKCANCEKPFESSPPVLLPCGHRICREECFSFIQMTEEQKLCPVNNCAQRIPETFDENETPEDQKEQMKLFKDYQERCNRFYMQVVSQLCFANSTPPSEDVIQHLLQLIIYKKTIPQLNMTIIRTRKMTIFETVVDTTPVFRSFLLQLLIRSSEKAVFEHLEGFLIETDTTLQQQNKKHELELCLMLIQFIEDAHTEQLNNLHQDHEKEATFVKTLLSSSTENLQSSLTVMEKIRSVAAARFCLQIIAKHLKECYSLSPKSNCDVHEELFRMAAVLCDLPIKHIRLFLLTHICRSYGLDLYQSLLNSNTQWLFSFQERENTGMQECPDYCVVLGDKYREIRDEISKLLLIKEERINLKINDRSASVQLFYLLALIKEIKIRDMISSEEATNYNQLIAELKKEFERKNMPVVLKYFDDVIGDSFARSCRQLQIGYHPDIRGKGIVGLLLHFSIAIKTVISDELLHPLVLLATQPISMKDSFLPTMPEEVLSAEIRNELQRMEELANKYHHSVTWYRCPNGHPYAVGDCGNPTETGNCYQCNAEIGGELDTVRGDNVLDSGVDFSQPGHILGSPDERSTQSVSERTLSPSSNILLRFLTHMALLIGANEHSDDVCQIIRPVIPTDTVTDFLWAHLNKDIDTLQVSLDRSLDEVFMFLHSTIHSLVMRETNYGGTRKIVANHYNWTSKEGRLAWETDFDRKYFSRLMQERQEFFEQCQEILSRDRSMGSDPILRAVFTKVADSGIGFLISSLQSSPHVWQHKTKVTFEHFVQEFHVIMNKDSLSRRPYFVLEKFLQQEWQLCHLRHIPDILQMLNILVTKYGKQITRDEAETITLHDCVNQLNNDSEQRAVDKGLSSFCELWNTLRHTLISVCGKNEDMRRLFGNDIDNSSANIRAVLPDTHGVGLCSRIILEYIIKKQNDFVKECGHRIDPSVSTEKSLTWKDLTAMHLICFKREADIFPIILSNCNYTYMQAESTKLEYDFENIQAVLQDKILFGKTMIDTSSDFPSMSYKADSTASTKFNELVTKIPQEPLNWPIQCQIAEELSDLPEVYVTIDNIDVVVNILLSIQCKDDLLNSFMVDTLHMKPLPSSKAAQCCKLTHVQSLWFLLFHEKTKRLHYSEKEAFDSMNHSIQESLSSDCVRELESYLNELSEVKLEMLLEQLMECILFTLNCGEGDTTSFQCSLSESLMVHLENPVYPDLDLKTLRHEDVRKIPDSISTVHAVEVWKKIHKTVRSRK